MKYELPINHGLSEQIVNTLIFTDDNGKPSLTDAQYAALESGLGKGKSVLVVSPTSTGKTQIAVWAIAKGIETNANTVYLVTHRALAKQKFNDFKNLLGKSYLNGDSSNIVLASGDAVVNGLGDNPADPLNSSLLVATYEKYLAMLSASGVPSSLANTVVVCDEIQLIGDKHRGQNVEVLLTLLRNARWKQFIGLSAVLAAKDGNDLANWLNVSLVFTDKREKKLRYEYWGSSGIETVTTSAPENLTCEHLPKGISPKAIPLIEYLKQHNPAVLPIIVFCMSKKTVYELAAEHLNSHINKSGAKAALDLGNIPQTTGCAFLSEALAHRIAIHSTDLTEEEKKIVEEQLIKERIDVVYATSTLAAGVHFPLGTAIFHGWQRWNSDTRSRIPIETSEFHNMAGRVGRMGSDHEEGKVIFFPEKNTFPKAYKSFLELDKQQPITCRIDTKYFNQLSLQLIAAGLCRSRTDVTDLVCTSFSGLQEEDNNTRNFKSWPGNIDKAISLLVETGLVIEMADKGLSATPVGKAVAHAGLRPASAIMLLKYFASKGQLLVNLLNSPIENNINRFAYLIFAASFSLPEFNGKQQSRFLPWPLKESLYDATAYADDLLEPNWYANLIAVNAAQVALDWINGVTLEKQEKIHSSLRAGMLLDMYRNLGWIMQGMVTILSAVSDSRTPDPLRPTILRGQKDLLKALRKLPRSITRLSFRVSYGLPDDALWMNALNQPGEPFQLRREEILALRENSFATPELLMSGTQEDNDLRCKIFAKIKPSPHAKANWLRKRCRSWKSDQRLQAAKKHQARVKGCREISLIDEYYTSRGEQFEAVFEKILEHLGIVFERLDDKTKTGAPDYLIQLEDSPALIFELKSRQGDNLVDYNKATEVLTAAEIHGYKDNFCVTLCHPGVDPSVPSAIIDSGRLSVVESHDLGEGLLRLCQQKITQKQLWQWLATPGQALSSDLPYTGE